MSWIYVLWLVRNKDHHYHRISLNQIGDFITSVSLAVNIVVKIFLAIIEIPEIDCLCYRCEMRKCFPELTTNQTNAFICTDIIERIISINVNSTEIDDV